MGFASDEIIEVQGMKVLPRDVLMKLVQRLGNKFIEENQESTLQSDLTGILDITVDGEKDGGKLSQVVSYKFTDFSNQERQLNLNHNYGTTMMHVALPAVVGAKMCLGGEVESGVISPDSLDLTRFFEMMSERGVPFELDEKITRHTVFKRG